MWRLITMLIVGMGPAYANWDPQWLKPAEVVWQSGKPAATDAVGASIYCGFASFSKGTRILLSVQNRSSRPLCFTPNELVQPTAQQMERIRKTLPPLRTHLTRAVGHYLSGKEIYHSLLETEIACRSLHAKDHVLAAFTDDPQSCLNKKVELLPGDVFEASIAHKVPLLQVDDFTLKLPSGCSASDKEVKFSFRCEERADLHPSH